MKIELLTIFIGLIVCQAPVDAQVSTMPVKPMTMTFVVDVTGSMSTEIKHVQQAILNATYHLTHYKSLGIDHFALVTFSDPKTLTKSYEYTSLHRLHTQVMSLKATGGGDCPEYGLDGLMRAINISNPNSYIFYFSDAAVKDTYLVTSIYNAAKKKNVKIWIIGTGCCTGVCSTYSPYVTIANKTGGVYYSVSEKHVEQILKYVNENIRCRKISGLVHPPKSITLLESWLLAHPGCILPPPPPTLLPPPIVGSASSLTGQLFSLTVASVAAVMMA